MRNCESAFTICTKSRSESEGPVDDDVKTLLAILALIYGSSNGVGLLKTALDPVKEKIDALKAAFDDPNTDKSYLSIKRRELVRRLFSFAVIIYVLLVAVTPIFLILVLCFGVQETLNFIGLAAANPPTTSTRHLLFYWILLFLALVSSLNLLGTYLQGWRAFVKYRR